MKKALAKQSKTVKNPPHSKDVIQAPIAKDVRVQTYLRVLPGKKGYPGSMRLQGCDLIKAIQVPPSGTSETAGLAYTEVYVNPSEFEGTRLTKFAELYEKFLFNRLRFVFQPCKASTQDGSVGIAYDRDIDDPTPPPSLQGLRQFCAWYGTKVGRVWDKVELEAPLLSPEVGFYTDTNGSEDRMAYQGQAYVFCEVPTGLAAGTQIGDLYIEYDVDLFIPALDAQIPTTSYYGNGSTPVTQTDVLRPGAAGLAGAARDALAAVDVYPPYGLDTNGISKMFLPEGLHRMTVKAYQTAAGSVNLQSTVGPVMTPREPVQNTGQAPQWYSLFNAPSGAATDFAFADWLFNIPKGGVDVVAQCNGVPAATGLWRMDLVKLGKCMASDQFTKFAQSLFT